MCWLSEQVGQHNVTFRCNNIDALANAVADGLGLGILPCLVGSQHPGLRCLSGDQAVLSREIWLVLPRELRDVPRVRVVGDWLIERFRRDETRFSRLTPPEPPTAAPCAVSLRQMPGAGLPPRPRPARPALVVFLRPVFPHTPGAPQSAPATPAAPRRPQP
jgi:hypothetical protein